MTAGPDWARNMIVQAVADQIPRARRDGLQTQDIAIPGEASEPQPDLVMHERDAFEGPARLIPAPAFTLLVEVVSKSSLHRDYRVKRSMYAAGRLPAYLIIDPLAGRCVLLTEPRGSAEGADHAVERTAEFGDPVPVGPLGVVLDTAEFRTLG